MLYNILLGILVAQPVLGWGELGHRTVGYLGQKYLSNDSKAFVAKTLSINQTFDISDAAVWPDGPVKKERPYTSQWHWIDASDSPPRSCGVVYARDCTDHGRPGCIISAIANMTTILTNISSSDTDTKEALMFLIHFLGDIHQPLHTESLLGGGNGLSVTFDRSPMNIHSTWDYGIPNKYRCLPANVTNVIVKASAKAWAEELYDTHKVETCTDVDKGVGAEYCALKWANESNGWICTFVLKKGVEWLKTNDLGGDYYQGAIPVIDDMITKAGARLGAWINAIVEVRKQSYNVTDNASHEVLVSQKSLEL